MTTIEDVLAQRAKWCVIEGDSRVVVPTFPAACINAVVTDPPSGISFMGAAWDHHKGGRAQWVAWLAEILAAARVACADGSRAAVWALPRTSHWTGCAVEDAGWTIETKGYHLFGTGWPKGKSQLKPAAEEWIFARTGRSTPLNIDACRVASTGERLGGGAEKRDLNNGTGWDRPWRNDEAASEAAAARQREAVEHASSAGRYPPNVTLGHADGCVLAGVRRVRGTTGGTGAVTANRTQVYGDHDGQPFFNYADPDGTETVDAWECVEGCAVASLDAQASEETSESGDGSTTRPSSARSASRSTSTRAAPTAGQSRFFPQFEHEAPFLYCAKPSRSEKNAGCDGMPEDVSDAYAAHRHRRMDGDPERFDGKPAARASNHHPTVKPVALMRWLIRLTTQPGDIVLDPFCGSATTGVAAILEGRRFIGVERDPAFAAIARARMEYAAPSRDRLATMASTPVRVEAADFGPLFNR